jgi:hypothetical protein
MLEPQPVRTYEEVREAIDSRLGSGVGMSAEDAVRGLEPSEHVVWALDNLLACLFESRLHIWDQGFVQRGYDGPRVIAAIAHHAREVDPVVADLLLWTVEWVRTRGVALTSLVPELWLLRAKEARHFLLQVAERWPEGLEPVAPPTAYQRPPKQDAAVGFTARGATCPFQCPPDQQHRDGVFRNVAWALWRSGAEDETLERFFLEYFSGNDEVETLCRFVSFDGDGGDDARKAELRSTIRPVHPLTTYLGEEPPAYGVVLVDSLNDVRERMGGWRALDVNDVAGLKRALRSDPDVLLVDGEIDDALRQGIFVASETGHLVFCTRPLGETPPHVKVLDRRRSSLQ